MARNLLGKYLWVLETIQRYGKITRRQLDECWKKSEFSEGEPLARRTFYNYRNAIEELFGISIQYDPATFEYFLGTETEGEEMNRWLVNSMAINNTLSTATDIASRIMLEDIPSAKGHLSIIIDAIKTSNKINISYAAFDRQTVSKNIIIEPYFLRIFKQRWYVIGYNCKDKKIKTYSLDRITTVAVSQEKFEMPDISVSQYFDGFFGITTDHGECKRVIIKAESKQAKYLRALPLHKSQTEQICDGYSIFSYNLHITYDLIQEILSFGSKVTVIAPPELKSQIKESLRKSLENYKQ